MHGILSITKALSDERRVRALLSVKDGELCLSRIIGVLGLAPSTVSRHKNVLQQAGLVQRRKRGKSRRSKMAEAWARRLHPGRVEAVAGTGFDDPPHLTTTREDGTSPWSPE